MRDRPIADAVTRQVLGVDDFLSGLRPASLAAKAVSLSAYGPADRATWQQEMARLHEAQTWVEAQPEKLESVRKHLGELPDLERPLRRLRAEESLGDAELFELKRFLHFGQATLVDASPILSSWDVPNSWIDRFSELLHTIHPEKQPSARFHLSDALDETLAQARREERRRKKTLHKAVAELEAAVIDAHGGGFDIDGFYRPPGDELPEDPRLSLHKGRLRVHSSELASDREGLEKAAEAVRSVESRVRKRLSDELRNHLDLLDDVKATLLSLDLRLARVVLLRDIDGCWATLKEDPGLRIETGRATHIKDAQPIDFESGPEPTIIVGPNMGGKSSLLALVGLSTFCAQHTIPVPARSFEFSFVESIVYVGAEEPAAHAQEEGLSSFGREVRRLVSWWSEGGSPKLWLLDEIGRGTHPEEGAELAKEIIEALHDQGDEVLAATHFPAVASLEGARKLRIAGLVRRRELVRELGELAEDPRALTEALWRAMDYRPIPTDEADVPRDAREIARALGLALPPPKP
ncbi:MAG: MutS-related protein [Bradymonadaceae bacterium]